MSTFSETSDRFLSHLEAQRRVGDSTITLYTLQKKWLDQWFDGVDIRKIDRKKVLELKQEIASKGWGTAKMNQILIVLRLVLRYAEEDEGEDVLSPRMIEQFPKGRTTPVFLSDKEAADFLAAFDDTYDGKRCAMLARFLMTTGLRISEALPIRMGDIDFERKEIVVKGKGGKHRVVYFTDELAVDLQEWKIYREGRGFFSNCTLFCNENLKSFSRIRVCQKFEKAGMRAGLEKRVTPHVLRHTFATRALRKGMGIRSLQVLLGHSAISVTERYTHLVPEHVREDYNRVFTEMAAV